MKLVRLQAPVVAAQIASSANSYPAWSLSSLRTEPSRLAGLCQWQHHDAVVDPEEGQDGQE